jgi:DNA polymerase-4
MKVGVIPGVGPVSQDKLQRIGVRTIGDLHTVSLEELVQTIGRAHAQALSELAYGRDDRPIEAERETKSISVEDTFEQDLVDLRALSEILRRDARQVASRLTAAQLFARTVSIKVRRHDFSTYTRSRTLLSATDRMDVIDSVAQSLLSAADISGGVRLLGVGVAGLTDVLQEDLFSTETTEQPDAVTEGGEPAADPVTPGATSAGSAAEPDEEDEPRRGRRWLPGFDVVHDEHGPGWIWGAGLGRVTVRFETRHTPPGPVRTFSIDDPALRLV